MNIRRGLFRCWIIFACMFVIAVGSASSDPIRREFEKSWRGQSDLSQNRTARYSDRAVLSPR